MQLPLYQRLGFDEPPRDEDGRFLSPMDVPIYKITVWDNFSEGDDVEFLREATERDLQRIEDQYGDDPQFQIDVERTS